ncbi:MAG: SCP2 domain-containing protein [Burkholderiales bacterium]
MVPDGSNPMATSLTMSLLAGPILSGLNHLLQADPALQRQWQAQAGKRIRFHAAPLPAQAAVIENSGFVTAADVSDGADLAVDIPVAQLISSEWSRRSLLDRIQVTGDPTLAALFRETVLHADWDIEDEIAKVVGDIPARRLSAGAIALRAGTADAIERLARNFAEYLAEERRVIVSSAHLSTFADDLSQLQPRLDALEARIAHIEKNA